MSAKKSALVVRGGWDGHEPQQTTDSVIPFLVEQGYDVRVEESTAVYSDAEVMQGVDLIVQVNTMSTIEDAELAGLIRAVVAGTGLAGWHGGIADSYRNSADYLQLIGGQFAHHAGIEPSQRRGEQSDNYLEFTVTIEPDRRDHPIVAGIEDFDLNTEQYWVLSDAYNDVLASTEIVHRDFDPWHHAFRSPVIWTRLWGAGRVFVCTAGHKLDVLDVPQVRAIVERGMLWASR